MIQYDMIEWTVEK